MSTLSPDPVIAYFEVVWGKELNNEHENLSGMTIWRLQVDFARRVNFISAAHTLKLRPGGTNSRNDPGV